MARRVAAGGGALLFYLLAGACSAVTNLGDYDFSCTTAADCPITRNPCERVSCIAQQCAFSFVPKGNTVSGTSGDVCSATVCDGAGHASRPNGTACGVDGGCDGQGACKCDLSPNECGRNDTGCIHCALAGECKDEQAACTNDQACSTILSCAQDCPAMCNNPQYTQAQYNACMTDCVATCINKTPAGDVPYRALVRCLLCDQCFNACNGDPLQVYCSS